MSSQRGGNVRKDNCTHEQLLTCTLENIDFTRNAVRTPFPLLLLHHGSYPDFASKVTAKAQDEKDHGARRLSPSHCLFWFFLLPILAVFPARRTWHGIELYDTPMA